MLGPEEIAYQEWKAEAMKEFRTLGLFKGSTVIGDYVYPKGSYLKGLDLTMWYHRSKELRKERLERGTEKWKSIYRLLNIEKKSDGKIMAVYREHTSEEWKKATVLYDTEEIGDAVILNYKLKGDPEIVSVINPSKDDIDKMVELANKGGD